MIDPVLVTEAMPLDRDVLACGPEPMLEAVRALAPGAQLAWEAPMACGYGACYGCVVADRRRAQPALRRRAGALLLLNASGCLDARVAPEVARSLDAFVTKTVTPEPREGNPPVRIAETESGMLNSIGLANPGPRRRSSPRRCRRFAALGVPLWVSVGGFAAVGVRGDVRRARRRDDRAEPLVPERRRGAGVGSRDRRRLPRRDAPSALREALAGQPDIAELARAVEAAGADGLSLVNTIRGLALDERLRPRLARATGGYSGPALKPIALAAVYACRRVTELPIVGNGRGPHRAATRWSSWRAARPTWPSERSSSPTRTPPIESATSWLLSAQMPALTTPKMPFAPLRKRFSSRTTERNGGGLHGAERLLVCPLAWCRPPPRFKLRSGRSTRRMEALKRANDIRVKRAQLKKDLKSGAVSIEEILREPPEFVSTAKVFDMLMAVPKFGRVKAQRMLNQCRISQSKTVGGLSDRQRQELIDLFNR